MKLVNLLVMVMYKYNKPTLLTSNSSKDATSQFKWLSPTVDHLQQHSCLWVMTRFLHYFGLFFVIIFTLWPLYFIYIYIWMIHKWLSSFYKWRGRPLKNCMCLLYFHPYMCLEALNRIMYKYFLQWIKI